MKGSVDAAKAAAEIAERALVDLETPFVYPLIVSNNLSEELKAMKDNLERLRRLGVEAIED